MDYPVDHIDKLLGPMLQFDASDIILKVDARPTYRINKALVPMEEVPPLTGEAMRAYAEQMMKPEEYRRLLDGNEIDLAYNIPGNTRYRVNAFLQRGNVEVVARCIQNKIRNFEELHLPPILANLTSVQRGMILMTGTTGSGKSTTLAALIEHINQNHTRHIVTIEDPIEFVYTDKKSIISQREVGIDTLDFKMALKHMMRQNPDVILIGEMRDKETVEAAIAAAETGHMVFSTLHTADAAKTIDRIMEFYPKAEQDSLRAQLAQFLVAGISQRLVPRADGQGMVPAIELMFSNPIIRKLILENRIVKLKSAIHQGAQEGMQTFDQALVALHQAGWVTFEAAAERCSKPSSFKSYLEGYYPDIDAGILG
ncbi:MAG TPA: PilT/PilU family type 4a pilus ATPase [bacterium]|nr:PilT/PilU family type 4a pilus ATPase [bacterium]